MTNTTTFDWRGFLLEWSGEWADSLVDDDPRDEDEEAARQARWLGFPPASEERITALERRTGLRLPPSYRSFLRVSDGWQHAGGFVRLLAGTDHIRCHDDESGLAEMFEEYLDEDAGPEERRGVDVWRRGLQLDVQSDCTYVLMDPEDVAENDEWAVYTWASWRAAPPERHEDFAAFMRNMHREFHSLRARRGLDDGAPVFANATTRRLDAQVEEARTAALKGDWQGALAALDEAAGYGRPHATELGDQIRRLLGRTDMISIGGLITAEAAEPLPPMTATRTEPASGGDDSAAYLLQGAGGEVRAWATGAPGPIPLGENPPAAGPFGEAVGRARELARWGETDAAWRTLMDALPQWEPPGPDYLAPLGWLASPVLEPLLTEERGRELLATPRGGASGTAPAPTAGLDPDGLAWLAEPDPGGSRTSYRFVLMEGVEPADVPGRLMDGGVADTGPVNPPMTPWEAHREAYRGRRGVSSLDDRALMAVGRAGEGWSFAFDSGPARFHGERFVSPAAAASAAGARAVVVWSDLRTGDDTFHLSVARDGVEEYAFTYADGEVRSSGAIPAALAPDRFFGSPEDGADPDGGADRERALLAAVEGEFGVRLPRHALTQGRLHTFTSRSWTRPPQEGESCGVIGWYLADPDEDDPAE
ncbi:SMI1/KNR4 family protein [Streptomyces sp. NPDC006798]|uniref:SMI1/KNR4 family protein n=1 Tax=Streptomyces sp. NPDC006798 TaxID=3155462 RepID=UPI0033C60A1E